MYFFLKNNILSKGHATPFASFLKLHYIGLHFCHICCDQKNHLVGILQNAGLSVKSLFINSDAADSTKLLAVSKPLFPELILLCATCIIELSIASFRKS